MHMYMGGKASDGECMQTCLYVYVCVYIYTHAYIYIYTHAYIHKYTHNTYTHACK